MLLHFFELIFSYFFETKLILLIKPKFLASCTFISWPLFDLFVTLSVVSRGAKKGLPVSQRVRIKSLMIVQIKLEKKTVKVT